MSNTSIVKKSLITHSTKSTRDLAKKIAQKIIKQKTGKTAFVLTLSGELGSGKTTFVQGLAEGLGIKDKVISPTFVIIKKFKIKNQNAKIKITNQKSKIRESEFNLFYHIDAYRIDKPEEVLGLGWREIVSNPRNIVAIEWPERIKKFLPKNTVLVKLKFVDKNQRKIEILELRNGSFRVCPEPRALLNR